MHPLGQYSHSSRLMPIWMALLVGLAGAPTVTKSSALQPSSAAEPVATDAGGAPQPADAADATLVLQTSTAGNAQLEVGISGIQVADDLRARLQSTPPPTAIQAGDVALDSPELIARFYGERGFRPAWVDGAGKPLALVESLLAALNESVREGLSPAYYHKKAIVEAARALKIAFAPTVRQVADFDLLLSNAFLTYGSNLVSGRINPQKLEGDWYFSPRSRDLVKLLDEALASGNIKEALAGLPPSQPGYVKLREALAHYRAVEKAGGWPLLPPGPKLSKGMKSTRVQDLRAYLEATGDLKDGRVASLKNSKGKIAADTGGDVLFDGALAEAVRQFQKRHGLTDSGAVDAATLEAMNVPIAERIRQIELNMERWRWLPEQFGERHILVNITDYEMSIYEGDHKVFNTRAIVGKSGRPTPALNSTMSYLVFSPYWYVPHTIAVEDKLPMLRKNPYALRNQGIRVFAGARELDPGKINWRAIDKESFNYTLRQDPGPRNALGRIKFMFPNRYNVYIHDTPSQKLFESEQRTYSSGCIRIDDPVELAEYLLNNSVKWTRDAIVAASKTGKERRVDLPQEIPVFLLYWTAWADANGQINFRNDIYSHDPLLARVLFAT